MAISYRGGQNGACLPLLAPLKPMAASGRGETGRRKGLKILFRALEARKRYAKSLKKQVQVMSRELTDFLRIPIFGLYSVYMSTQGTRG